MDSTRAHPDSASLTSSSSSMTSSSSSTRDVTGLWTAHEHERFLDAMARYPRGPWRVIAEHVGSRSIKQVQTHAQKYQQKLLRHQRGLRKRKTHALRVEHRVDEVTVPQFTSGSIVRQRPKLLAPSTTPTATTPATAKAQGICSRASATTHGDARPRNANRAGEHRLNVAALVERVEPVPFAPARPHARSDRGTELDHSELLDTLQILLG